MEKSRVLSICELIFFLMHWDVDLKRLSSDQMNRLKKVSKGLLNLNTKLIYPLNEYETDVLRLLFKIDSEHITNKYLEQGINLNEVEWDYCIGKVNTYMYFPEKLENEKTRA